MIWTLYDINNLTQKEYVQWYRMMSADKKARVNQFFTENDRKRSVAADHLARQLIAEWFKIDPFNLRFFANDHGKPFVEDLPIHFSISHSGKFVFCAVSDLPIGADIEIIRPVDFNIAKRFCTEDELNYIQSDPNRFFELWTAKEACAKLDGRGLAAINEFSFFEIKPRLHTIQTKEYFLTVVI